MDRRVAHGARLIFGRLIMRRSHRSLSGRCVTLQAQQIHLADAQVAWVSGTVWSVTAAAALSLHRYMLIHERPLLVGVTFDTDRVSAWHGPHLSKSGCAVDVMAVAALNKAFVYSMVIWLREVSLRGCMTA